MRPASLRPLLRPRRLAVLTCVALGPAVGPARAEGPCANAAFRKGISAGLPECRAYELVTPAYKQGSKVSITAVAGDGSRAIAFSEGNFGDAHNSQGEPGAVYALTRSAAGWSEENLDAPAAQFPFDQFRDASTDLSSTLWDMRATAQPLDAHDLVIKGAGGTLRDLGPVAPPSATTLPPGLGFPEAPAHEDGFAYQGASSDLSHVLFQVQGASTVGGKSYLWPGDNTEPGSSSGFRSLYEYTAGDAGPPALVGVDSGGALLGACGVSAGAANGNHTQGAISSDGTIVFFTPAGADDVPCPGAQPAVDELFARVEGARTVAISDPVPNAACSSPACRSAPSADAEFEGASDNGQKAYFASTQQLTDTASADTSPGDSSTAGNGAGCAATAGPGGCNLYLYDFGQPEGHNLIDVSRGDASGAGPQVQGVLAISRDASHVYFVAKGVLASNANGNGELASAGAENLYVSEPDPAHTGQLLTAFIGTLASADSAEWEGSGERIAAATPGGRFLAFNSFAHLTPDASGEAQQVFRYDAQTGELTRVSVGAEVAGATLASGAAQVPVSAGWRQPAAMSEDGAYVVFQSADGLAPLALNDQPVSGGAGLAQNIYVYHDGTIALISDGQDATATEAGASSVKVLGTTASGGDIFFQTADRIAPQDTDTEQDVYDARIDGGFATQPAAVPCQDEGCQDSAFSPPQFPTPSSVALSGQGNLPAPAPPLTPAPKPPPKPLTAKQKLAKALKLCRKKPRRERPSCIRNAHRRYGPKQKPGRHTKASK